MDFCILTLYFIHLLCQLIPIVLVLFANSFRLYMQFYHLCKKASFISSFLIDVLLISLLFFYCIRSFCTILKSSGKKGYPFLVLELCKRASSFFIPLSIIFVVGFLWIFLIKLSKFPSIPNLVTIFYHEWVFDFIKCSFCIYLSDNVIFLLQAFDKMDYINSFLNVEPALHIQDKFHLLVVHDSLYTFLDSIC